MQFKNCKYQGLFNFMEIYIVEPYNDCVLMLKKQKNNLNINFN